MWAGTAGDLGDKGWGRMRMRKRNGGLRGRWELGTGVREHLGSQPSCTGSPSGGCTRPSPHPRRNGGPQGGRATAWQAALSHSVPGRPGGRYSGRSAVGKRSWAVTQDHSRGSNPDPGAHPMTKCLTLCSPLPREPLVTVAKTNPSPVPTTHSLSENVRPAGDWS